MLQKAELCRTARTLAQVFIVLSQVFRVGVPFTIIYFSEFGGSIMPYFILRFVDSAFG